MSEQYKQFLNELYNYEECVDSLAHRFGVVKLDDDFIRRLSGWVENVVARKRTEEHHSIDGNREHKRWTTGYLGECAVEKYLGESFIDWSVGDSAAYHKPDLSGLGIECGIKTVEHGKFPLIFKNSKSPEFIVIRKDYNTFWLCGWGEPDVLNEYQNQELILDKRLKSRGTKTAFYGFEHLIDPFFLKLVFELDLERI